MNWGTLRAEVLNRLHDTTLASMVPGWYNDVQSDVDSRSQWRHLDKKIVQPTTAPYSTGTVAVTNGSKVVTGSGTNFPSASVSQLFRFNDGTVYDISTVDTATQITLVSNFIGSTATAQAYTIYFFQQDAPSDFSQPRLYNLTVQAGTGPHYKLRYVTEDQLFDFSPNEAWTTTRPWRFRFFGAKVQYWPPPNAAYNIVWYYSRTPTEITTSSVDSTSLDWPQEVQYVILLGATCRGLQFIDDSLWGQYKQEYETRLKDEVEKNNSHPTTEMYMRRWDEYSRTYPQPLVYPRTLG